MANGFEKVRPGDVISSVFMNNIIDNLQEMEKRIAALESQAPSTGQVVITGFDPANQERIGKVLTISGLNFEFPPTNNTVTFDGVRVTEFRSGSTDVRLKVVVPAIPRVPTTGKNVTVSVSTTKGSTERLYRILPAVPVSGNPPTIFNVTRENGSPNLIVGEKAIITGLNFSATPEENLIRFIVQNPDGDIIYPKTGETLQIQSATQSEIQLTVPDIDEVPPLGGINITLEVGVGAHLPGTKDVNIRRS